MFNLLDISRLVASRRCTLVAVHGQGRNVVLSIQPPGNAPVRHMTWTEFVHEFRESIEQRLTAIDGIRTAHPRVARLTDAITRTLIDKGASPSAVARIRRDPDWKQCLRKAIDGDRRACLRVDPPPVPPTPAVASGPVDEAAVYRLLQQFALYTSRRGGEAVGGHVRERQLAFARVGEEYLVRELERAGQLVRARRPQVWVDRNKPAGWDAGVSAEGCTRVLSYTIPAAHDPSGGRTVHVLVPLREDLKRGRFSRAGSLPCVTTLARAVHEFQTATPLPWQQLLDTNGLHGAKEYAEWLVAHPHDWTVEHLEKLAEYWESFERTPPARVQVRGLLLAGAQSCGPGAVRPLYHIARRTPVVILKGPLVQAVLNAFRAGQGAGHPADVAWWMVWSDLARAHWIPTFPGAVRGWADLVKARLAALREKTYVAAVHDDSGRPVLALAVPRSAPQPPCMWKWVSDGATWVWENPTSLLPIVPGTEFGCDDNGPFLIVPPDKKRWVWTGTGWREGDDAPVDRAWVLQRDCWHRKNPEADRDALLTFTLHALQAQQGAWPGDEVARFVEHFNCPVFDEAVELMLDNAPEVIAAPKFQAALWAALAGNDAPLDAAFNARTGSPAAPHLGTAIGAMELRAWLLLLQQRSAEPCHA